MKAGTHVTFVAFLQNHLADVLPCAALACPPGALAVPGAQRRRGGDVWGLPGQVRTQQLPGLLDLSTEHLAFVW